MPVTGEWFCALLDSAPEVYFRYALAPARRVAYVSPSIQALTGHSPEAFYDDANLCGSIVAAGDRHLFRRMLRSRRGLELKVHLVRDGISVPVDVRTVPVVRNRRLIAIEGVARLSFGASFSTTSPAPADRALAGDPGPIQQRLTALMIEVHGLLHRVLPSTPADSSRVERRTSHVLHFGALALDANGLTVTESGKVVALTTREVLLLRYLLQRPGRIVTRQQLLTDVWGYSFTGDDRTVDVHVSRLRRKLPSLRERLVAIRNVGYRIDEETEVRAVNG